MDPTDVGYLCFQGMEEETDLELFLIQSRFCFGIKEFTSCSHIKFNHHSTVTKHAER